MKTKHLNLVTEKETKICKIIIFLGTLISIMLVVSLLFIINTGKVIDDYNPGNDGPEHASNWEVSRSQLV